MRAAFSAHSFLLAIASALALSGLGCPSNSDDAPVSHRTCGIDVWYRASSTAAQVEVVGSWNQFARPGIALAAQRGDGWRTVHVDVPAGEHRYAIVDDGVWQPDPIVGTTAWEADREVSWVRAEDCGQPKLTVVRTEDRPEGAIIEASFTRTASNADPLDPSSVRLRGRDGVDVTVSEPIVDTERGTIQLRLPALPRGKHTFTLAARDRTGRTAAPVRVSVWTGDQRPLAREDIAVYQIMIDRFAGDDGALVPPVEPGARAGGTLKGIRDAVERGDFAALGITTLWLSPVYKNPTGFYAGGAGRRFSAYHGYWPVDTRAVDPALGGEQELDRLVDAAHARGLRILLDVVPNHVHEDHPWWKDRTTDIDFNAPDGRCVCGAEDCPWSTNIERCWFAPYLPDLNTRNEAMLGRVVEDVLYWIDRFDLDGLRIDAVPMMPRSTTRRIAALARARFEHEGNRLYQVGENFTDEGGFESLRYQLGPMGLDGEFHFPLMWSMRNAIALGGAPMKVIDDAYRAGESAFAGSGAVMATMIGNHDVTRFASESDGTAAGDGFTPAPTPTSSLVYAKQKLALGLLFALPGAPVIYYGDEVALAGRLDPDSRRVMPADVALTDAERDVRNFVRGAGTLRACSTALRRGRYLPVAADAESLAFARAVPGNPQETAIAIAVRQPAIPGRPLVLRFDPTVVAPGHYVAADGNSLDVDQEGLTSIVLPPFSIRVFLPAADPCFAHP